MPPFAVTTGTVIAFDDHAGLGRVRDEQGDEWPFHCTRIADGSRTIAVGALVTFTVLAGPTRAWEASDVRPATP